MRAPAPVRRRRPARRSRRRTRFVTVSTCRSGSIPIWRATSKPSRSGSSAKAPTPMSWSRRDASPRRRSICAACAPTAHRLIERAMPDPKVQAEAAEPAPRAPASARVGADDRGRILCADRSSSVGRRPTALDRPVLGGGRQEPRGARSLRAPRPVAAQIRHPRVRPRAPRGRTARPRRGRGELRRGGERRLRWPPTRGIRPATLSCTKSWGGRFRDRRASILLSIDFVYCLRGMQDFGGTKPNSKDNIKSTTYGKPSGPMCDNTNGHAAAWGDGSAKIPPLEGAPFHVAAQNVRAGDFAAIPSSPTGSGPAITRSNSDNSCTRGANADRCRQ